MFLQECPNCLESPLRCLPFLALHMASPDIAIIQKKEIVLMILSCFDQSHYVLLLCSNIAKSGHKSPGAASSNEPHAFVPVSSYAHHEMPHLACCMLPHAVSVSALVPLQAAI